MTEIEIRADPSFEDEAFRRVSAIAARKSRVAFFELDTQDLQIVVAELAARRANDAVRGGVSEQDLAAERKELEAWRSYGIAATNAITSLTAGGSEYFGRRIGEDYTADLDFCVSRIRQTRETLHGQLREQVRTIRELRETIAELKEAAAARDATFGGDPDRGRPS